jgi:hypothetical protein
MSDTGTVVRGRDGVHINRGGELAYSQPKPGLQGALAPRTWSNLD